MSCKLKNGKNTLNNRLYYGEALKNQGFCKASYGFNKNKLIQILSGKTAFLYLNNRSFTEGNNLYGGFVKPVI